MKNSNHPPVVPSLTEAQNALAQLATQEALEHLESALRSLSGLASTLQNGEGLKPGEQRLLERSLLRFRSELRDAGVLADQGLAYCQNWVQQLQPPSTYQPNGVYTTTADARHKVSLDA
jgi:hypothetical protein